MFCGREATEQSEHESNMIWYTFEKNYSGCCVEKSRVEAIRRIRNPLQLTKERWYSFRLA